MGEYRQFRIEANVTREVAELHKRFLADGTHNGCGEDCTDMYHEWSGDSKWTGGWDVMDALSKRFPSTIFILTVRGRHDGGTSFVRNGQWVKYEHVYPRPIIPSNRAFNEGMNRKKRIKAKIRREQEAADKRRKREEVERLERELERKKSELKKAS